ncbi:MAG: hypothetical protein MZV70_53445 [Desulfobacterales bacterium]|nr:hypothetical protein [Desulfobacterales bacterium]
MKFVYEFEKTQTVATQLQTGTMAKAAETAYEAQGKDPGEDRQGKGRGCCGAGLQCSEGTQRISGCTRVRSLQRWASHERRHSEAHPWHSAMTRRHPPSWLPRAHARRLNAESAMPSEGPVEARIRAPLISSVHTHARKARAISRRCGKRRSWWTSRASPTRRRLNQILFSPEGLATKFIKGPAASFVGRDLKRGYYPKEAFGMDPAF